VISHTDQIHSPDRRVAVLARAVLQFSGGFLLAVIVGYPVYRHWNRLTAWHSLDAVRLRLTIGLGIGRVPARRWGALRGV